MSEKLGDATRRSGLIVHAGMRSGRTASGESWTSGNRLEAFQNFVQNKLIPAIAEVNPDAPQAEEPEILEVHELVKA